MKKVFSFLIVIILAQLSFSQGLVKGKVADKVTKETLISVTILNPASCTGVNTSFYRSFDIKISAGNPELRTFYIGYSTNTIEVSSENYKFLKVFISLEIID